MIENLFDSNMKLFLFDYGKIYFNEEFKNNTTDIGIELKHTATYTAQQNGRSEMAKRTIMEVARNILYARNLPSLLTTMS